jgi:hypothetical protein
MSETIRYCPVCIQLDQVSRHFLWYSKGDDDRFVIVGPDRLLSFDSNSEVAAYASSRSLSLRQDETANYNFDRLAEWLAHPTGDELDCNFLLGAWNLFMDVTESIGTSLPESDETTRIRMLLFWGCNLPSATPPGERFDPSWNDDEVATIRDVLSAGLNMLRNAI